MMGTSVALPAWSEDSTVDRVFEPTPKLADPLLKRSQALLSALSADSHQLPAIMPKTQKKCPAATTPVSPITEAIHDGTVAAPTGWPRYL